MDARPFFTGGALNGKKGTAATSAVTDPDFGKGQAIDVVYPGGNRDQILLFADLPFVLFRSTLQNAGKKATVVNKVRPVGGLLDLAAGALRTRERGTLWARDRVRSTASVRRDC